MRRELGGIVSVAGDDEIDLQGPIEVEVSYEQELNMCRCCACAVHVPRALEFFCIAIATSLGLAASLGFLF